MHSTSESAAGGAPGTAPGTASGTARGTAPGNAPGTASPDEVAVLARVTRARALLARPRCAGALSLEDQAGVLELLGATPAELQREVAWGIIREGLDVPLLDALRGAAAYAYRDFVAEHVPELRRARDITYLPPVDFGPVPHGIERVAARDVLAGGGEVLAPGLPGHDTIILGPGGDYAYCTGMDGWIWRVDLAHSTCERFVNPPLMPAGAVLDPTDPDVLLVVTCRHSGNTYPVEERAGLYAVRLSTGEVEPVLTRVPNQDPVPEDRVAGIVFGAGTRRELPVGELDLGNSRPASYFNDLAVSEDGTLVFITESSPHTSMGPESTPEAVTLARNGLVWRLDRRAGTVALAAQNYCFTDGIVVENGGASILVGELMRFRMVRLHLEGARAGQEEELWRDLPGMPDGIHRDPDGRIWVALFTKRNAMEDFLHRNPWLKRLVLSLPFDLKQDPHCGYLVLSPDASTAVRWVMHSGRAVPDISSVTVAGGHVYFASFSPTGRGLHRLPLKVAL